MARRYAAARHRMGAERRVFAAGGRAEAGAEEPPDAAVGRLYGPLDSHHLDANILGRCPSAETYPGE